jgi:PAS domain S-box-containing protein
MNIAQKLVEFSQKCNKKFFDIDDGFRISGNFLIACISFSIVIIIIILSFPEFIRTLISVEIPHNNLLDHIYFVLDPLLLVFISGIIVFGKYFSFLISNSEFKLKNIQKNLTRIIIRFILAGVFLFLSLYLLNKIENYIIKPIFSVSRPIYRLEHSMANSIYENGYQNYKLKKEFSEEKIESVVFKAIYRIQDDTSVSIINKNKILSTILKDDSINLDIDEINKAIDIVVHNIGNYNHDISLETKYLLLLNIYENPVPELWLTSRFEENKETDLNSTPSGFIIRIVFIWFLGAILITQKKKVRKEALIKNRFVFVIFLTFMLVLVGWSRAYGYYHTFYDELISFTFVNLFVIGLILLYYIPVKNNLRKTTKKLKIALYRLNKYYNEVPECFYITNDADKIISCNRVFEETFGFESGEAIGVDIKELYVDSNDRKKLKETLFKSDTNKIVDYLVYVHKYKQKDKKFVISVNSVPFEDISVGTHKGVEGTARLISEIISDLVDGFYQVDNDENITYCNKSFGNIFGFSKSSLLKGRNIRSLYLDGNEREKFLGILERDGIVTNFIVTCKKFKNPDSSEFEKVFVEVNSQYINPQNRKQGIQGTIRELPFGQAIITHSFHGIYVIQKKENKFKFSFCNENLMKIFGYQDINEFLDVIEVKDLVAPEDWDKVQNQLESKLNKENEFIKERYIFKGVTKEGKKIPIEIISNHYPSFKNHPAVIGNLRDLTEEFEEKSKISAEFTKMIILAILHEIYSPLIGIKREITFLYDDLLNDKVDNKDELLKIYKTCQTNINFCIQAANYLRDINDKLKIPRSKIKLQSIIESYISMKKIPENIELCVSIDNTVEFFGDEIGFGIVLSNLIRNTSESTNKECIIKLYVDDIDEENLILYFEDNGPGINQNQKNNLFELFTIKRRKGHQGLGLITTKLIITNWGGDISLYNTGDKGTIFKINLKK